MEGWGGVGCVCVWGGGACWKGTSLEGGCRRIWACLFVWGLGFNYLCFSEGNARCPSDDDSGDDPTDNISKFFIILLSSLLLLF
jgi:hypothetical protein